MPRYFFHKDVLAIKIGEVIPEEKIEGEEFSGTAVIFPEDSRYAPFSVSREYMVKHNPIPGGYYVVCKDGHTSFPPADVFED